MIQDTQRAQRILSVHTAEEFLRVLQQLEPYYIHDIQVFKQAIHQIEYGPINYSLLLCLLNFMVRHPDGAADTVEILRVYLQPIYEAEQYPTDSDLAQDYHLLYPILGVLFPSLDELNKLPPKVQRGYIQTILDIYIPTEMGDEVIFVANKIISYGMIPITDEEFWNKLSPFFLKGEDFDNKMILLTIKQVRRYLSRFMVISYDEKVKVLKDIYSNYEYYTSRINVRENTIAQFQKYFGEKIIYIYDDFIYMYQQYLANENQDKTQALLILQQDLLVHMRDLYRRYQIPANENVKIRTVILFALSVLDVFSHCKNFDQVREGIKKFNIETQQIFDISEKAVESFIEYPNPYCREEQPEDMVEAMEDYKKSSSKMQDAQANIYKAYKNYKNAEQKVDSQITKMVQAAKRLAIGDTRTEIIEGKKFSAIGLLKKALGTAAVFSFGPIKGLILLVVRYALKKKTTNAERKKILLEMQVELDMLNEKIEDARGDGNRQAKYAMMRTRAELEAAINKIKYGIEADEKMLAGAKDALKNPIGTAKKALRG